MALARIGVGANLGDAARNVRAAIAALSHYGRVVRASSLYRAKAWGHTDQPDFINAAVIFDTELDPHGLLGALKTIERQLGRKPNFHWGPRAIDLDILAYDDVRIDDRYLTIPHAQMHKRAFVLVPLAEIDPSYNWALNALPKEERDSVTRI